MAVAAPRSGLAPALSLMFRGARPAGEAFPLDVLCIAPHPDDAELGMGGALLVHARRGLHVGVLDLSRGELASNGTPAARLAESAVAAEALGLCWRGNLGLRDRDLEGPEAALRVVAAIRWTRPAVLCIPSPEDPHPDHRAAHRLCLEAWFSAGLRRYAAGGGAGEFPAAAAFRPRAVLQYFINGWSEPSLVLDVTAVYAEKRAAIAAHVTQFAVDGSPDGSVGGNRDGAGDGAGNEAGDGAGSGAGDGSVHGTGNGNGAVGPSGADDGSAAWQVGGAGVATRLNRGQALAQVEARDQFFGARAGVGFAEGFILCGPAQVGDFGCVGGWGG